MSNISLQDFNQNFTTMIRGFEREHTDETGTYLCGVGFNVVCNNNNRVMYFESHISSNMLPSNYNDSNIIAVGWSNVLPDVKTWASDVITSSNILGYPFTPSVASNSYLDFQTTSNFSYATYGSNFTTSIWRMETFPANNPTCWCVGFVCTNNNNPSAVLQVGTQVVVNTFAVYRAEQEILDLGWSNLKERIGSWAESSYRTSPFLNTVFASSNW